MEILCMNYHWHIWKFCVWIATDIYGNSMYELPLTYMEILCMNCHWYIWKFYVGFTTDIQGNSVYVLPLLMYHIYTLTPYPLWSTFKQVHFGGWAQDWCKSDGCFSPNLISLPWRRYEDYNISFCKQWKFRCHCSYEQWHLNLHCLQWGPSCP